MKKAGLILDDLYNAFQTKGSKYDMIKHHPYHRDWIEVVLPKDYLLREEFKMIAEICEKHKLDYHASAKGRIFKKIILCIYDK